MVLFEKAKYVADTRRVLYQYEKQLNFYLKKHAYKKILTAVMSINQNYPLNWMGGKSKMGGKRESISVLFSKSGFCVLKLTMRYPDDFCVTETRLIKCSIKDGMVLKWPEPKCLLINGAAKELGIHKRIKELEEKITALKEKAMIPYRNF